MRISAIAAILLILSVGLIFAGAAESGTPAASDNSEQWFQPAESVAAYRPKGPSHCFRLFNVDWSWVGRPVTELPAFLSRAEPAALAEFLKQDNVDGTVVMAVPHHGYCSYETKIGTKFPGMRGDWFGQVIEELHKRKIAAFGYVTINWNFKYMREHLHDDYVQAKEKPDGSISGLICLNAPGYLELVEGYTREVIEKYPVDGMRWDIAMTAPHCTCAGCKTLYKQLYGEQLVSWKNVSWQRHEDFRLATIARTINGLTRVCRQVKPSLEIWHNQFQSYEGNDLDLGRSLDVAYNEFGDPFRLLFLKGVLNKGSIITGAMLESPNRRLCMVLGGCGYSYFNHFKTDYRTMLPGGDMPEWHKEHVAPFYRMIADIQPYLEGARPVSTIGIVFSEATRRRFSEINRHKCMGYSRRPILREMERISRVELARNNPVEFINRLDLPDPVKNIARFKLLMVPLSSGFAANELQALREYVRQGGTLLIAGDALRHDEKGVERENFAMADAMGVRYDTIESGSLDYKWDTTDPVWSKIGASRDGVIRCLVKVSATEGETPISVEADGQSSPLLHLNRVGRGTVAYLASLDSAALTQSVIDRLAGPAQVVVSPAEKQAILTYQAKQHRWILHLISDGPYTIFVRRTDIVPTRVVAQYPTENWSCDAKPSIDGLEIKVDGEAKDRLLVLE